ncbi:M20/M25/M40 family metallo-hydrolase [Cytobacillus sp. NCCP-133]|uniref:M20/M25/M40 family metallo-hydrolase n=1 Tax=Cytobacillus sp. NCCP-133 TaxID=766848 RepID=UPI00223295D8|nr:M20/M25/M40 family metallo-hydrolase [Cytobacillus sp. NCCP-133]GLB58707.1 protein RocB [Cytobacillus sp. NCCP-133]
MFAKLISLSLHEQAEYLTRALVQKVSYNHTEGERKKAGFLEDILRSFPYFEENKDHVWTQDIPGDELGRKNVYAFLSGTSSSKKTLIYLAHLDTVGTEDFGPLQNIAHDPEALHQFFLHYDADPELQQDAISNEWLFGRGALDMQSGIAVHLANLLYFSDNLDELDGNLLVMFTADEEGEHRGSRAALGELLSLKKNLGLEYMAAINNDFISPLYDGDQTKYIYTGTAGKVLPCFSIFGRETHAGESLAGIDPTLIAAELTARISQNFQLTEKLEGELVLPPSCLFMRDDKKRYDVQTAVSCRVYFNYFVYEKPLKQLSNELKTIAEDASIAVENRLAAAFKDFRNANELPERHLDWKTEVTTLDDFLGCLDEKGIDTPKIVGDVLKRCTLNGEADARIIAFDIVEALHQSDPEKKPRVILFYGTPFLPANTVDTNTDRGIFLRKCLEEVLEEETKNSGEIFKVRKYFPYLSDGSFLSFRGSDEDIQSLKKNFPGLKTLFPIPLRDMRDLNIPVINLGVYGKAGHKWTERVYKPYTLKILPELIRNLTKRIL